MREKKSVYEIAIILPPTWSGRDDICHHRHHGINYVWGYDEALKSIIETWLFHRRIEKNFSLFVEGMKVISGSNRRGGIRVILSRT
jgi:hypothetical protein